MPRRTSPRCARYLDATAASRTRSCRRSSAASTTTRARRSSSSARGDRRAELDDLRRRPLRRPDRGDRRPADAGRRLRRRHRAARSSRSRSRGAEAADRAVDVFFVVEDGATAPERRSPRSPSSARAGVAADTDYAGRSLKGQLTQAGASARRRPSIVARRRRDRPARRRAGRTSSRRDELAARLSL